MRLIKFLLLVLCFVFVLTSCHNKESGHMLRMGIIQPSIDHLPITLALQKQYLDKAKFKLVTFSSGWEVQEAISAGKIDLAIMPFTYAWTAIAKGRNLKIVSCLERETDGVVADTTYQDINQLDNKKIGLLRASTLEVLMQDAAIRAGIDYKPVYFRTPTEMVAALKAKQVDAIVSYVPIIQKMGSNYHVAHWFSESNKAHPCCDLVATEEALKTKAAAIKHIREGINKAIIDINRPTEEILQVMNTIYGLDAAQAREALKHTVFDTRVTEADKQFERNMMESFVKNGYLNRMPALADVYYVK